MFKRTRNRVRVAPLGASLTEQKWRERQDVNNIVERCLRGDTSGLKTCGFQFADVADMPKTLQDMLNQRLSADAVFDSLPTEAKEHYVTPSRFIKALSDESERSHFEKFGLLKKPEPKADPVKVEVINPSPVTPPVVA